MNKIALWVRVDVDDWTGEGAIIASNIISPRRVSSTLEIRGNKEFRWRNVHWNMLMWTHLRPAEILKAGESRVSDNYLQFTEIIVGRSNQTKILKLLVVLVEIGSPLHLPPPRRWHAIPSFCVHLLMRTINVTCLWHYLAVESARKRYVMPRILFPSDSGTLVHVSCVGMLRLTTQDKRWNCNGCHFFSPKTCNLSLYPA